MPPSIVYRYSGEEVDLAYQEHAHWKHMGVSTLLVCVATFHMWAVPCRKRGLAQSIV